MFGYPDNPQGNTLNLIGWQDVVCRLRVCTPSSGSATVALGPA